MRVAKTDVIAGVSAPVAREIVRRFYGSRPARAIADLLPSEDVEEVCRRFAETGFLAADRIDGEGRQWWIATISGNALAMASFGKPISRATGERHVREIVERARAYNADPSHTLFRIDRLRVFGSYLDSSVDRLGDVDIEVTIDAFDHTPEDARAYARASGRTFDLSRVFRTPELGR